jgi:hypothetical protein
MLAAGRLVAQRCYSAAAVTCHPRGWLRLAALGGSYALDAGSAERAEPRLAVALGFVSQRRRERFFRPITVSPPRQAPAAPAA